MSIKTVFGGGVLPHGIYADPNTITEALTLLEKSGISTIDSARLYPGSEEAIGKQNKSKNFTLDTKLVGGFGPGNAAKDSVIRDITDSLSRLKTSKLDILYMHAPDDSQPIADTLDGINTAYKKGQFARFGLSNYTPQQVQEVYDICKKKGYMLPSVYQGNYSPVARHLETLLFPTLRRLGMVFYAYSPLAGGFLTKTTDDLDAGAGRFNAQTIGGLYQRLYDKPSLRSALGEWNAIAEAEGVSKAELAYRWVGYNSMLQAGQGDAVIFGASRLSQIEETAGWLKKGGLSQEAVQRIDGIWQSVKADAPVDNFGANKM
jgi:aflatoxin B1 aldehyde reductase